MLMQEPLVLANTSADAAIAASPSYFQAATDSRKAYYRPEDHNHLLDGLRKAGWRGLANR